MSESSKLTRRSRRDGRAAEPGATASPPATAPSPSGAKPHVEIRSMAVVARAVTRAQARALMFERLAIEAADLFRGNDFKPPRLLLKLPGGGPFPVELEDVTDVECELTQMASEERLKVARLMSSGVQADPDEVDLRHEVSGRKTIPTPEGESTVENPAARPPTPATAAKGASRTRA